MDVVQAAVLGLVQGLTEFLPVSSSGHLVLVPRLLGWREHPLSFDVALHLGTALAVLLYFRRDMRCLIHHGLTDLVGCRWRLGAYSPVGRLALLIVLGCLPAVAVGGLFNDWIEAHTRQAWLVALLLVVFGVVMLLADRCAPQSRSMEALDPARALFIGMAQALALLPGVSRSGATIAAGMFAGLSRETAARFSFLLAAPVILGAGVKELPNLRHAAAQGVGAADLAVGFVISFVVGLAAIHFLLRYVALRPLTAFVLYRFALAGLVLALLWPG